MVKRINRGADLLPEQATKQDVIVDFTCGICLTVVKDMVECSHCNGLSCAVCIYSWLKRDNTCPKCRQAFVAARTNNIVKNMLRD